MSQDSILKTRIDPHAPLCKSDFIYEEAEVNYAVVQHTLFSDKGIVKAKHGAINLTPLSVLGLHSYISARIKPTYYPLGWLMQSLLVMHNLYNHGSFYACSFSPRTYLTGDCF